MSVAIGPDGRRVGECWHPGTPGELVESLEDSAKTGMYFEIDEENAAVLLAYIRGLERDSRALTEIVQNLTADNLRTKLLDRLAWIGAYKIKFPVLMSFADWRGLYGSAG